MRKRRRCQQKGWAIQIFDAHSDVDLETRNMLRLPHSNSDGAVILHTCDNKNIKILQDFKNMNFPYVMVDRCPPGMCIDFVESNHEQGAYLAANYLLERGHRQILMLTPPPLISSLESRIRGYEYALTKAGITTQPQKVFVDVKRMAAGVREKRIWLGGYEAIMPVLKKQKGPLAIFASEECTAWGVYQACRELDLRIPEDVSVISFDDTDISRAMVPSMTVVAQRTDQIAQKAVDLLERRLQQTNADGDYIHDFIHSVIDVELVERHSVATLTDVA